MIFNYNWLGEYLKGSLPDPDKFSEELALHVFEVEEVKKKKEGLVLDIDITSNRVADSSSHLGLARECSAIFNLPLKLPETAELKESKRTEVKVGVKDKDLCPRYMAAELDGIEVRPSPDWMREKLLSCGLKPINNVVDTANYVMLETGQPLHAFDLEKLAGKKIVIRRAEKGESLVTLDGGRVKLSSSHLVIADGEKPVAVAGIKGGEATGVSEETKKVVVEAANFDPVSIRKTSQDLKLRTDASYRFEHGLDPNLAEQGLKRMVKILEEVASAELVGAVDFYPEPVRPKILTFHPKRAVSLLGVEIPKKNMISIFESLGLKVIQNTGEKIKVEVPTRRVDIEREEDLVEEVGRIYGYENIEARIPTSVLVPPTKNLNVFWEEKTKDVLKEAGFSEVYNYSFIGKKEARVFDFKKEDLVLLANPLSKNYLYLCPSLLCNLVGNVAFNLKHFDRLQLFEVAKVFKKEKGSVKETRRLAGVLFEKEGENELFFRGKGALDSLFCEMGITDDWYDSFEPTSEQTSGKVWTEGRSAEIKVRDQELGFLGFLHPMVLKKMGVKGRVVGFTLDFERLQKFASGEVEYEPVSPFPKATRDLAVLVPGGVKVVEVLNVINRAGGEVVRDVDLFDIYSGEELPRGKKNLAFHIVYQAENRTLESGEINKIHQEIVDSLEEEGWEVRK